MSAVEGVSPSRFEQEPAYTAALLGRLTGSVYHGPDGFVLFETTNVNSIGPGAAERWSGADFAITARIRQGSLAIDKAILAQAKRGALEDLKGPSLLDRRNPEAILESPARSGHIYR